MPLFRRRRSEQRALTLQDVFGQDLDVGSLTHAGVRISQEGALSIGAAYAAARLIAESIATLPLDSYIEWDEARKPYRPKPAWIAQPNLEDTPVEFWEQVVLSLLLDGNAYCLVTRDEAGLPLELLPLHPSTVKVQRHATTKRLVYALDPQDGGSPITVGRYTATGGNLWHVRGFRQAGSLLGMSPIEKARQTLGLASAADEYAARFFGQGALAGGVIEFDKDVKLDEKVVERILEAWRQHHSGTSRSHTPGVLGGGASWKQISIPPDHAQFLETRKFSVAEIARWFRVPPHLIGDVERSTSWGSGIEEQNLGFVTYSLRPWLVRLEQAAAVFMPGKAFVRFGLEGLLRAQTKNRYESYGLARQWGWMSVDDIRALEDLPPLPNGAGSVYLQPANMSPAGADVPPVTPEAP